MAYQWITIDEALVEFHATAEKIIKMVEDEVIDRGPDRVAGERKLMQVSLSQLKNHFQEKDTASQQSAKIKDIALGTAVGISASEAVNLAKKALKEEERTARQRDAMHSAREFSHRMRELRARVGLSRSQLARESRVSITSVSDLERGRIGRIETAYKVFNVLNSAAYYNGSLSFEDVFGPRF